MEDLLKAGLIEVANKEEELTVRSSVGIGRAEGERGGSGDICGCQSDCHKPSTLQQSFTEISCLETRLDCCLQTHLSPREPKS